MTLYNQTRDGDDTPSHHAADIAIAARNLHIRMGGQTVLHIPYLRLPAHRWTAIVGPNGAGKSTLLRALAGIQPIPADSAVQWGNTRMEHWPPKQRARHMAWLGQGEDAAPDLSVYDIVMLGRLPHQGWLATPDAADRTAVEHALHSVRGWDWRHRRLGALSGGERQRILLARALATQAPLLLMDEPLMHLDPPHQADWMHIVRTLIAQGSTVISVLHELNTALQADDLLMLRDGHITHHGAATDPASHQAMQTLFDHRVTIHHLPASPTLSSAQQWVAVAG